MRKARMSFKTGFIFAMALIAVLIVNAGCSTGGDVLREDKKPPVEAKEEAPKAFLGVSMGEAPDLKPIEGVTALHGVIVHFVVPDSPAEVAGMKSGDIIVAVGEKDFDAPSKEVVKQFRDQLADLMPGDRTVIKVVRKEAVFEVKEDDKEVESPGEILTDIENYIKSREEETKLDLKASVTRKVLSFEVTMAGRPVSGSGKYTSPWDYEIHPELAEYSSQVEDLAEILIEQYEVGENYEDLRERLEKIERAHEGFRLPEIIYLHRNPFHMEKITVDMLDRLQPETFDVDAVLSSQLFNALGLLGEDVSKQPGEKLRTGITLDEHLTQIEQTLESAGKERAKAFDSLTEEEIKLIRENAASLGEVFEKLKYIHSNEDTEQFNRHLEVLKLAHKVKYAHLHNAAMELQRLLSPEYLKNLARDLQKHGIDTSKEVLAQKDTPWGKIIIGGTADNWYMDKDAAVIIDLGGDDFYTNNSGSSTEEIGCAIVIDIAGDDVYESSRDFTQGTGLLGVGILADLSGNDSYIGLRWCQGSCFFGVGMMIDAGGDDSYRAHAFAQGAALWGTAHAIDLEGCDRYESHSLSQGVGMCKGVGIVCDVSGDDSYYCKGTYPTGYGTPGIYEGWGQGCGVGFRNFGSGGIGIVLDIQGCDRYEAGNFSQGGGYYYGWGVLGDRGGEADTYIGSRYAQGFCAHQALGTFIEDGGDDTYASRNAVHAGLAWDECVTLFIDRSGDDNYGCPRGFSQCASAHNAICIFMDMAGKDTYATIVGPGRSGPNDYHDGTSLSLFIDLGGQEDSYVKDVLNNAVIYSPQDSLVIDLPFSDLSDIEAIKKLCKPYEKKEEKKPEPEKPEESKKAQEETKKETEEEDKKEVPKEVTKEEEKK